MYNVGVKIGENMKVGDLVRLNQSNRVGFILQGPWAAEDVEGETLLKVNVLFMGDEQPVEIDTDLLLVEVVK